MYSLLPVQVHTKVSDCVSGIGNLYLCRCKPMCDCVSGMVNSLLPVQVLTKVSDCVSGIGNSLLSVQVHTKVSECVIDIVNSLLPVQVHTKVLRDKKEDQTKTFLDSLVAATVSEKAALENMRSDKDLDGIFSRIGGVCWDTHTHTPSLL